MSRIGITGSRSIENVDFLCIERIIRSLSPGDTVVQGACRGVDAAAAYCVVLRNHYAETFGALNLHTVVPGPRAWVARDFLTWDGTFEYMPEGTDYRARNLRILEQVDRLIAFPLYREDDPGSTRSGSWMTIRMARDAGIPVEIHVLTIERDCLEEPIEDNQDNTSSTPATKGQPQLF